MPEGDAADSGPSFLDIVEEEASVLSERRSLIAEDRFGRNIRAGSAKHARKIRTAAAVSVRKTGAMDERRNRYPAPESERDLAGLALSGGGIRSAAFSLGVTQALASLTPDEDVGVIDSIDYLSTVSGGGYLGTSLVAGLMQTDGKFPFASKLDQPEPLETQHIRDYSNYLAPGGFPDMIAGAAVVLRGLLINAMIFLGVVLAFAWLTTTLYPDERTLRASVTYFLGIPFSFSALALAVFLVAQVLYAIFALRPTEREEPRTSLTQREGWNSLVAGMLIACAAVFFVELQIYVLIGIFDAASRLTSILDAGARKDCSTINLAGCALIHMPQSAAGWWAALAAGAAALAGFGNKLISIVAVWTGDNSWSGMLKRWASRFLLYLASILVPLLIWLTYLILAYRGMQPGHALPYEPSAIYGCAALILLLLSLFVAPNSNSLHGYYRDRLSRAFLWQKARMREAAEQELQNKTPAEPRTTEEGTESKFDVDRFLLSSLKKGAPGRWQPDVRFSPYLLVNTAVNLEASRYLNRRGRNADSFFFSPLFSGSQATGYARTTDLEAADRNLNLGTALAISGAAASANMGAQTIRTLTFSLAALNVRLGYWLPNPRLLKERTGVDRLLANIAPWYFAKETFGQLDENTRNVYLTDGGHFDNIGLYELLKRRCKIIIVADAEADPQMNFPSLVRLEMYARIDLGILIDLPWRELRQGGAMKASAGGEATAENRGHGPHVAIGRIDYGEREHGVIFYVKASLSGDENDNIADYHRRMPQFPHETTLDQFFSEEQFEVYRALGFHAARNFFTGGDNFAALCASGTDDWPDQVRKALQQINIAADAIEKIVQRQQDAMLDT